MSSSFEKSVKGATKIKAAPPKTKYIEHILVATHSGEAGIGEVFRALQFRLRDSTWTVVFKGLITVHFMIREGRADATLQYLAKHTNILAISSFTDGECPPPSLSFLLFPQFPLHPLGLVLVGPSDRCIRLIS